MKPTVNWILVPIDFSEESRLALKAADGEAQSWGSGLILLHVKKPTDNPRTRMVIEENALQRWARWIEHTPKNRVAFITVYGDAAEEILRIARQYQPRKIIMGRGGDARQPGSVTHEVGRHFPRITEAISTTHDDVFVPAVAT